MWYIYLRDVSTRKACPSCNCIVFYMCITVINVILHWILFRSKHLTSNHTVNMPCIVLAGILVTVLASETNCTIFRTVTRMTTSTVHGTATIVCTHFKEKFLLFHVCLFISFLFSNKTFPFFDIFKVLFCPPRNLDKLHILQVVFYICWLFWAISWVICN